MNIISAAMRRSITTFVIVVGVVLGAILALDQMPRDIFPDLEIPTIYVAQPYGGMDPAQMEGYSVSTCFRFNDDGNYWRNYQSHDIGRVGVGRRNSR